MTERTLRDQIASLPRYEPEGEPNHHNGAAWMAKDDTGDWIKRDAVLALLDAHAAAQPAPDAVPVNAAIAAAACTCGRCGGLVCCQNCGTPPRPAPDAVAEADETRLFVPRGTGCASDQCNRPASVHFIRGGVGSYYCAACYVTIQSQGTRP